MREFDDPVDGSPAGQELEQHGRTGSGIVVSGGMVDTGGVTARPGTGSRQGCRSRRRPPRPSLRFSDRWQMHDLGRRHRSTIETWLADDTER
jgi:hypothetical protein